MNEIITAVVTVCTAIVGVALLAVLVSKNAQTPQVIQAAGRAFSQGIGAAVSPVTGGSMGGGFGGMGNFGGGGFG